MTDSPEINFTAILNGEFRWPRPGDNPLVAAPGYSSQGYVALPTSAEERAYFIASGFMEAAQMLASAALEDRAMRAHLALPALFCFRHAIEVNLKSLLADYGPSFQTPCDKLTTTHDLAHLWNCFTEMLDQTAGDGDAEGIAAAAHIVLAFNEWDSGSFAFRYPTDRKGQHIPFPEESIDLANLLEVMKGFANFLMGVDGQLSSLSGEGP